MELYLMRHGIALPKDDAAGDFDRPLTDKGAARVRNAAKGMRRLNLKFDLLLSSPLVRARQTADIVAGLLHHEPGVEELPSLAPEASVDKLIADLARYERRASLLLVGHEPSLSSAVAQLIAGKGGMVNLEFKKAGLCLLDIDSTPRAGGATLRWLITPKQLRALGERPRQD
jgi:phosphohistidine phosphatase